MKFRKSKDIDILYRSNLENKKGITLIALVITIIILLLLAGISINMITSQDGILNKTVKAKKTMNEAELEEKIKLAVTEWNLEKESNDSYTTTLEEYIESKEEITSANIEEPMTLIIGDNVITINKENKVTVGDKSKNLIKNGYLENKNNDNFPNFKYNPEGYLTYTTNEVKSFPAYLSGCSDEYIPVDSSEKYKISITAKKDNINGRIWLGLVEYDIDYKTIKSENFMYVKNTLTYLTQDLKNGDTEIHLNDISNFEYNEGTPEYKRGLIIWNYKDSTGYQYSPLTYSRNVYTNLFDYNEENRAVDKENNVIKLREPWNRGTIETGTKVSQSLMGTGHKFIFNSYDNLTDWKTESGIIQGTVSDGNEMNSRFRPGTKYVRFVYYAEVRDISQNATAYIKDIVFEKVEE